MTTNEKLKAYEGILIKKRRNSTGIIHLSIYDVALQNFYQLFSYELKGDYHVQNKDASND